MQEKRGPTWDPSLGKPISARGEQACAMKVNIVACAM